MENILQETEIGQKFDGIDNDKWKESLFLKEKYELQDIFCRKNGRAYSLQDLEFIFLKMR
jgi:hypothetical protein